METWCGGLGNERAKVKRRQMEMWGGRVPGELAFREGGRIRRETRSGKEEAGLSDAGAYGQVL